MTTKNAWGETALILAVPLDVRDIDNGSTRLAKTRPKIAPFVALHNDHCSMAALSDRASRGGKGGMALAGETCAR
jgi:hypothetical protein